MRGDLAVVPKVWEFLTHNPGASGTQEVGSLVRTHLPLPLCAFTAAQLSAGGKLPPPELQALGYKGLAGRRVQLPLAGFVLGGAVGMPCAHAQEPRPDSSRSSSAPTSAPRTPPPSWFVVFVISTH